MHDIVDRRAEVVRFSDGRLSGLGGVIDDLLLEDSEVLFGEEKKGRPHRNVGKRRGMKVGGGKVIVAKYSEDERDYIETAVRSTQKVNVVRPLGHVEVSVNNGGNSVDIALYLSEDERVLGLAHFTVRDYEDVFSTESVACYDFLDTMGLGRLWVDHMTVGENWGDPVELDDLQLGRMTSFLQSQFGATTGG